jgi:hypothetical protein
VSTLAVEINDAGLLVRGEPDVGMEWPPASPGYALLDGGSLLTGIEAANRARLKPRHIHNRFWSDLDTSPLPQPFPGSLTRADLAHAHLASLWDRVRDRFEGVILAIPGSSSDHQLGLTLGIARACEMPVTGMVDAAVAAAGAGHPGSHLLHLDLHLHRTVLTELSQGREIVRRRVEVLRQVGLDSLRDAWSRHIARSFVHQTRFDPLHTAPSEQTLFQRLPDLLAQLCTGEETLFEMKAAGRRHAAKLTAQELAAAARGDYESILELIRLLKPVGRATTLLLSHRAALLPGLRERLAGIGSMEVIVLPEEAAVAGALRWRDRIHATGEELPFVICLPAGGAPSTGTAVPRAAAAATPPVAASTAPAPRGRAQESASTPRRSGMPPTHILHQGVAHAITGEPFVLGIAIPEEARGINLRGATAGISRRHCSVYRQDDRIVVEDHSTHGSFLDDQRVYGRAELIAGDRLRVGSPGIELQLIRVAQSDGQTPG